VISINLGLIVYVVSYSIKTCTSHLKIAEVITGMSFTLLACLFAVTGVLILKRLKKYFPEFHRENHRMIGVATGGLSVSLLIRGISDNLRYFSMPISDHINKYETIYNPLLLLLTDIIPICFQLSTLIFGYIRKRNDKKYRLEIKMRREEGDTMLESFRSGTSNNSVSSASNASSYFDPPLLRNNNSYQASNYSASNIDQIDVSEKVATPKDKRLKKPAFTKQAVQPALPKITVSKNIGMIVANTNQRDSLIALHN